MQEAFFRAPGYLVRPWLRLPAVAFIPALR
jgi:hypothetical protein